MPTYQRVAVTFEHTTPESNTVRANRAVLTVYGDSEFAVLAELKRQRPECRDIVLLEVQYS